MPNTKNILIVGVGGQGILLASELVAKVALSKGYDVKQSEVHGMAQRGGSVSSNVRYGDVVYSPTIARGEADVLLSFELLESLRWLEYLSPRGVAIVNTQRIDPMPVASGKAEYPKNIEEKLQQKSHALYIIDGQRLAEQAGHIKAVNVALLGVLSTILEFDEKVWQTAIKNRVPAKTVDINFKAFNLGREAVSRN
ncbi:indolepyruvate oxidoreductase subunit beta [candidate division KSB1 bacterium]|nr:indolepyruvate oxidoreductase subunit beta [candidate division KSB1 bacterium]RQW02141.1 MAG: indolepyruvate oxidoreductase subunit beta [candidate division KSB1 bacterium]